MQVVDPEGGARGDNAHRVLINLHGGAFMWGAGSGALVEAIPIAAVAGMRVVAVDYRLAPEHTYPAAVDDVEAVYRELMKDYRPENIGIYGCSAGGALTAQATARILQADLPRPGAIGTFCGSGMPFGGDSAILGRLAMGESPMPADGELRLPYLQTAKADDPVAYPGESPELLARFPPTFVGRRPRFLGERVDHHAASFAGCWRRGGTGDLRWPVARILRVPGSARIDRGVWPDRAFLRSPAGSCRD